MRVPPYSGLAQKKTLWQGAVGTHRRDIQPRHSYLHLLLPGVTAPRLPLQLPRNHPWALQGLPNDELSLQNAAIVTKAQSYPLLVDPQVGSFSWG